MIMAIKLNFDFNQYDLKYSFPFIRYVSDGPDTGIVCIYEGRLYDGMKYFVVVFRSNTYAVVDYYETSFPNTDSLFNTVFSEFLNHCAYREFYLL